MLNFHQETAEIFIPDGVPLQGALERTTHICIAAHQDDIEMMAVGPILECFRDQKLWFSGVVVTDGSGSPREGIYANYSENEMRQVRRKEQRKAAVIGEYAVQILLDYPSQIVQDARNTPPVEDITRILRTTRPEFVFTHNLADKHDTHVAVALRVIAALRALPKQEQPARLYGCEVWRDLDWLVEGDKTIIDLSQQENMQLALLGVFDSQISGGKRYDLAALARRRAHATYHHSHGVDAASALSYAIDMTPLLSELNKDPQAFIQESIQRFAQEVGQRIQRLS